MSRQRRAAKTLPAGEIEGILADRAAGITADKLRKKYKRGYETILAVLNGRVKPDDTAPAPGAAPAPAPTTENNHQEAAPTPKPEDGTDHPVKTGRIPEAEREKIFAEWTAQTPPVTIGELARKYQRSYTTILSVISRAGGGGGDSSRRVSPEDRQRIIADWEAGNHSIQGLANKYRYSWTTIRSVIRGSRADAIAEAGPQKVSLAKKALSASQQETPVESLIRRLFEASPNLRKVERDTTTGYVLIDFVSQMTFKL